MTIIMTILDNDKNDIRMNDTFKDVTHSFVNKLKFQSLHNDSLLNAEREIENVE